MSTKDLYQRLVELRTNVILCLPEVRELDICNRTLLQRHLEDPTKIEPCHLIQIKGVLDYMFELINVGNWKHVKPFLRKTITIAFYVNLLALTKFGDEEDLAEDIIKEGYRIIDRGIVFGSPLDKDSQLLQNCAKILNAFDKSRTVEEAATISSSSGNTNDVTTDIKYPASLIETLDCPSMEYFYKNHISAETPVLLDNCINHWPALSKWKDQEYLMQLGRHRLVPVEIGKDYTDSEWTQKLMTIDKFIENHIYRNEGATGYLAQYQLFDHIPELKQDISQPEYCCFSEKDTIPEILAWYGPKGTVTPLHFDDKKNLLAQVIGEKVVFLFAPSDSKHLYKCEHELMYNMAEIDPRKPDLEKYPNYKNAKPYYCVLRPGQMLYIPPKWWHFVESLSLSFSVSFWWE